MRLSASEDPEQETWAARCVIKNLSEGQWGIDSQGGQTSITRRVPMLGKNDIKANRASLIGSKQDFHQIRDALS